MWILDSISVTESAQVLDKHQTESPGSLQSQPWASPRPPELPQLCQHPPAKGGTGSTWGAHSSQSVQLSSHVLAVVRCCTEKDQHMNIKSHKALSQTCRLALPGALGYGTQALLILVFQQTARPGQQEREETVRGTEYHHFQSHRAVPKTPSSDTSSWCSLDVPHPRGTRSTAITWGHVCTQRQSTAHKEQHRPSSHCQNSTGQHHHA